MAILHKVKIPFVGLMLLTATSFANESGWKVVQIRTKEFVKPEEIARFLSNNRSTESESILKQAIARLAAGLPVDPVVSVTETTQTLQWTGPTDCVKDDPRLTVETGSYNFKFASGHVFGSASANVEADPCSRISRLPTHF